MKAAAIELDLTPVELERRLVELPGAFVLRDGGRWLAGALPSEEVEGLSPRPTVFGQQIPGSEGADGPHAAEGDLPEWLGLLPYEAFRALERGAGVEGDLRAVPTLTAPRWRRYPAVIEMREGSASIVGEDAAAERLASALRGLAPSRERPPARLRWVEPVEEANIHEGRVRRALDAITRGELYQVNLARRFVYQAEGHPIELLRSLGRRAEAPFSTALEWGELGVISMSPELFLDVHPDGRVLTRPIKGTRPRSSDPSEDARAASDLDADEKERAELAMVIDIERNDLGRLAEVGSVRLVNPPKVVGYPTVFHREAEVAARLRAGTTLEALLWATMPSGSITGAPKVRAMDLIAELEAHRRGLYTGALGTLSRGGHLHLAMAIRTLTVSGHRAEYFSGGGIVADSDPAREVEETQWKAAQLPSETDPEA